MKKLLLLLASCFITNHAIAMFCGCKYCSGQQEVELRSANISKSTKGLLQQIKLRLTELGVDATINTCGYLCIITTLYKKGIIRTNNELYNVVDEAFTKQLEAFQSINESYRAYDGTMTPRIIYNILGEKGFIISNTKELSEEDRINLIAYIKSEIDESPEAFFTIRSNRHIAAFVPSADATEDQIKAQLDLIKGTFVKESPMSKIETWDFARNYE